MRRAYRPFTPANTRNTTCELCQEPIGPEHREFIKVTLHNRDTFQGKALGSLHRVCFEQIVQALSKVQA